MPLGGSDVRTRDLHLGTSLQAAKRALVRMVEVRPSLQAFGREGLVLGSAPVRGCSLGSVTGVSRKAAKALRDPRPPRHTGPTDAHLHLEPPQAILFAQRPQCTRMVTKSDHEEAAIVGRERASTSP